MLSSWARGRLACSLPFYWPDAAFAFRSWTRSGAPALHSYALALHGQSLRLLEHVGLLPSILEKGYEVTRIGLYEGSGREAEIRLTKSGSKRPGLLVLQQDILESLLVDALADYGVHVHWSHRASKVVLQPDEVVVTIDRLEQESMGYGIAHSEWIVEKSIECEASFVVGADGYHSLVRRAAEIEFPVVGDPQCYAVFELRSDADLDHEMRIMMGDRTTDVLWPLPNGLCRFSFELPDLSLPADSRQKDRLALSVSGADFPVLSEESCHALIAQRAPWFKGTIGEMNWRVAVRFEHRLAKMFGRDRIALAGDAAHLTGPVGMQSMNVGLARLSTSWKSLARCLRVENQPNTWDRTTRVALRDGAISLVWMVVFNGASKRSPGFASASIDFRRAFPRATRTLQKWQSKSGWEASAAEMPLDVVVRQDPSHNSLSAAAPFDLAELFHQAFMRLSTFSLDFRRIASCDPGQCRTVMLQHVFPVLSEVTKGCLDLSGADSKSCGDTRWVPANVGQHVVNRDSRADDPAIGVNRSGVRTKVP